VCFLALISCWLNDLSLYIQITLTGFVVIYTAFLKRSKIAQHHDIKRLQCNSEGYWLLVDERTEPIDYVLSNSSVVIGKFFFLYFKSKTTSINLVLANDSISNEGARKLRLALNVYKDQLFNVEV
jgi:hypothetical protein